MVHTEGRIQNQSKMEVTIIVKIVKGLKNSILDV